MASAAQPLSSPHRRRWSAIPSTFFKTLGLRKLSGVESNILGNILDDTIAKPDAAPTWTRQTLHYYAHWANCTDDAAQKGLKHLVQLGLIEARRVGQGKEYHPRIDQFDAPADRPPRTLQRKPPALALASRPSTIVDTTSVDALVAAPPAENGEVVPAENLQQTVASFVYDTHAPVSGGTPGNTLCPNCGANLQRIEGERKPPPPERTNVQSQQDGKLIPDLQAGYSKEGAGESAMDKLETFCVATITPKLGTAPPETVLRKALRTLGAAPVEMLTARIARRAAVFDAPRASWSMVALLAEDVAQAFHRLVKLRGKADPFDLRRHWASAGEVRRIYVAPDTPDHVRREVALMWPELESTAPRPNAGDEFTRFLKASHAKKHANS